MKNVSPRFRLLDRLKSLCSSVRNSSYYVKRGPILWASFAFDRHPKAISIQIDNCSILKRDGIQSASLSLEIVTKMKPSGVSEIDDLISDELIEDAEIILLSLKRQIPGSLDPVVFHVGDDASVEEFYDTEFLVQGIIVNFNVKY